MKLVNLINRGSAAISSKKIILSFCKMQQQNSFRIFPLLIELNQWFCLFAKTGNSNANENQNYKAKTKRMLIYREKKRQINEKMYEKFVSKKVQFLYFFPIKYRNMVWFGLVWGIWKKSVQKWLNLCYKISANVKWHEMNK